jgi:hypothetical protein
VLVQSHKSIVPFGALFCAQNFINTSMTRLTSMQAIDAVPHPFTRYSSYHTWGGHDSGRSEELLRPNIHHKYYQETTTQEVLHWEPVLGTQPLPKQCLAISY